MTVNLGKRSIATQRNGSDASFLIRNMKVTIIDLDLVNMERAMAKKQRIPYEKLQT